MSNRRILPAYPKVVICPFPHCFLLFETIKVKLVRRRFFVVAGRNKRCLWPLAIQPSVLCPVLIIGARVAHQRLMGPTLTFEFGSSVFIAAICVAADIIFKFDNKPCRSISPSYSCHNARFFHLCGCLSTRLGFPKSAFPARCN